MTQITIKTARRILCDKLKTSGISSYKLEADELLSFACGMRKSDLFARAEHALSEHEQSLLADVTERRLNGEPCAYIIGEWDFYSQTFKITSDVLIPRQDTETLIDAALKHFNERISLPLDILDLCCGSGCIGITLSKHFKNSHVTMCDISQNALRIADINIKMHGVSDRVLAIRSDMFSALCEGFDLIVCNPPYIKSSDIDKLDLSVRGFEPRGALDGGADGLDFYREIARSAPDFLNKSGALLVECGYDQANAVIDIFNSRGAFTQTGVVNDLSGVPRIVYGFN